MVATHSEQERLKALEQLRIMDTQPDPVLDELCEMASLFCDCPIATVSLLDGKRQWFKAKHGTSLTELPQSLSFCQYIIETPQEVLVIPNTLEDERTRFSPLVTTAPRLRFYAGAPILAKNNQVVGSLCVLAMEPKTFSEAQKEALKKLARKVMHHIESQNLIANQKEALEAVHLKLKKGMQSEDTVAITFHMDAERSIRFDEITPNISQLMPGGNREDFLENVRSIANFIHPEDYPLIIKNAFSAYGSREPWSLEYRVLAPNGKTSWHRVAIDRIEEKAGGVYMHGYIKDISDYKKYEKLLDEISFDISHVLRRPVTTLIGLMNLIETTDDADVEQLRFFAKNTRAIAEELDTYTRQLASLYSGKKKQNATTPSSEVQLSQGLSIASLRAQ